MNKFRLKHLFSTIVFASLLATSNAAWSADNTDYFGLAELGSAEQILKVFKSNNKMKTAVYGSNRETFLMLVLKNDRPLDIIEVVLDNNCSTTATAKDKRTPLMYAAQYSSSTEVLEKILSTDAVLASAKAAKITAKDKSGRDCLYYARLNHKIDALSLLSSYLSEKEKDKSDQANAKHLKDIESTFSESSSGGMVTFTYTGAAEEEPEEPKKEEVTEQTAEVAATEPIQEQTPVQDSSAATETTADAASVEEPKAEPAAAVQATVKSEEEMPRITLEQTEPTAVATAPADTTAETTPIQETAIQQTVTQPTVSKTSEIKPYSQVNLFDYAITPEKTPEKPAQKNTVFFSDPNEADEYGVTLLMKAAKAGNDWDVQNLINSGADINLRDKDGWSALMYAVRYQNNLSLVEKLIENGAHIRVRNVYNATPLLLAADYSQNPEIINLLLKNRSAAENEVYNAFILCLTSSSGSEHIKMAKVQLFLDMDISLNRIWKGKTPLMYACQYSSSTAVIGQLLSKGAKTNITDKNGNTAFDYAKQNTKLVHDDIYWSLNSK